MREQGVSSVLNNSHLSICEPFSFSSSVNIGRECSPVLEQRIIFHTRLLMYPPLLSLPPSLPLFSETTTRHDIVFAQMLPALVTAFMCSLKANLGDPLFARQLYDIGYLVHFESLLSTSGKEIGMIEDFRVAVLVDAPQTTIQVWLGGSSLFSFCSGGGGVSPFALAILSICVLLSLSFIHILLLIY